VENKIMNISFDSGHLTMEGSTKAQINTSIRIVGTGTELPITIIGEFKDIPPHLHGLYIQAMQGSYGSVNVYNNTEPEPKTIEEQKSEWRLNRLVELFSKVITKK
jgi:hypothetical protein